MAVYLPTADGWCRYCDPRSGGCSLTAHGETPDDAKKAFKDIDLAGKLEAIQKKKERGEKLTRKEEQIRAYAHPASCPSCYQGIRVER